jgi:hypothetical protein
MPEEIVEFTEPSEELLELEKKIELLTQARINLRVTPTVFDRLQKQAEFNSITIEEHCSHILEESLKHQVGKATINAPSNIGGTVQAKVVAPSSVSTVTRA